MKDHEKEELDYIKNLDIRVEPLEEHCFLYYLYLQVAPHTLIKMTDKGGEPLGPDSAIKVLKDIREAMHDTFG
jgi:hypothetical protein